MSITHILSATTPDDPAFEIRPSHWNDNHAQNITIVGNTSGASTISGTNIVLSAGPNVTISVNAGSLVWSGGAGAAGNTGYLSAGTTYASLGTVSLSNANGVSFGVDGQTITASHNALTSQSNQNVTAGNGGFAFQTLSFSNVNGVSFGTSAGSAITASHNALTSQSNQAFSADASSTFQTLSFQNSNLVSFSNNAGAIRVTHDLMASSSRPAFSADASSTFQTLTFQNSNGFTFSNNAGAIRASYSVPVVSNAIQSVGSATGSGTNTSRFAADDHVHAGVFSMGVSNVGNTAGDTRVDVGRFVLAGGNNITLSMATAANALNTITISAGAGGGAFTGGMSNIGNTAGTSGTVQSQMLVVGGPNITVSQSINGNSATLSISGNAPGAAAENNWFNLLGANTAGNTTASGSTIGFSGINLTLSGTNNSAINISAPATSSIVGTSGISVSTNGSTISIQPVTQSGWQVYDAGSGMVLGQQGQGTLHFNPVRLPCVVQFDRAFVGIHNTNSSNSSGSHTVSFWLGIYTKNASTLSLQASASGTTAVTHSGTAGSYSLFSNPRMFTIPFTTTLSGGDYWIGIGSRTTSGGANGTYSQLLVSNWATNWMGHFGSSHNTTYQQTLGLGVYTATTSSLPASVGFSQIRGSDSLAMRPPWVGFASGTA